MVSKKSILVLACERSDLSASSAKGLADILRGLGYRASHRSTRQGIVCGPMLGEVAEAVAAARPDLVVAINHTRHSLGPALKGVPRVATLLQDSTVSIQPCLAPRWNAECPDDRFIGFASFAKTCGYDWARCFETPLFMCPEMFKPVKRPPGPRFLFASNKGEDPLAYFTDKVFKAMPELRGMLDDRLALRLVQGVREAVDGGAVMGSFEDLRRLVAGWGGPLASLFHQYGGMVRFEILMRWHMMDRVHRQAVLEWFRDAGLRVVGRGWPENPAFRDAVLNGEIPRADLRGLYSASKWSLHVNSTGSGYHHRIVEILLSGGRPLVHGACLKTGAEPFDRAAFADDQARYVKGLFKALLDGRPHEGGDMYARLCALARYCRVFSTREDAELFIKTGDV